MIMLKSEECQTVEDSTLLKSIPVNHKYVTGKNVLKESVESYLELISRFSNLQ